MGRRRDYIDELSLYIVQAKSVCFCYGLFLHCINNKRIAMEYYGFVLLISKKNVDKNLPHPWATLKNRDHNISNLLHRLTYNHLLVL